MQQSCNKLLIHLELSCYVLNARSNHHLLHFQSHLPGLGFRKLKVYYIMICYDFWGSYCLQVSSTNAVELLVIHRTPNRT